MTHTKIFRWINLASVLLVIFNLILTVIRVKEGAAGNAAISGFFAGLLIGQVIGNIYLERAYQRADALHAAIDENLIFLRKMGVVK